MTASEAPPARESELEARGSELEGGDTDGDDAAMMATMIPPVTTVTRSGLQAAANIAPSSVKYPSHAGSSFQGLYYEPSRTLIEQIHMARNGHRASAVDPEDTVTDVRARPGADSAAGSTTRPGQQGGTFSGAGARDDQTVSVSHPATRQLLDPANDIDGGWSRFFSIVERLDGSIKRLDGSITRLPDVITTAMRTVLEERFGPHDGESDSYLDSTSKSSKARRARAARDQQSRRENAYILMKKRMGDNVTAMVMVSLSDSVYVP